MHDIGRAVDTLRHQLERGDHAVNSEADRDALLTFSDQHALRRELYGHHRHEKLLRQSIHVAEYPLASIAAAPEDRDAAEATVRWIDALNDPDKTPETDTDYRVALRVFGQRVGPGPCDNPPASISWIETSLSRNCDPAPDPVNAHLDGRSPPVTTGGTGLPSPSDSTSAVGWRALRPDRRRRLACISCLVVSRIRTYARDILVPSEKGGSKTLLAGNTPSSRASRPNDWRPRVAVELR